MSHSYLSKFALSAVALGLASCATLQGLPETKPSASAASASTKPADAASTAPAAVGDAKASTAAAPAGGTATRTPPAATPPAAAPGTPPPPRPFAEIIKDAKEEKGFFTTWYKDDKVWIEIPETMWDKPFFFSVNVTHALGDAGIFGNQMGGYLAAGRGAQMASFRKHGPTGVQLIAKNTAFTAAKDSTAAKMVERSFSDSLLGNATVVSAPHPEKKSVLIEANALLVNDYPSVAARLEQAFRQPYSFDARNSSIAHAKNSDTETGFHVRAHYGLAKVALPSPVPSPAPPPKVPSTLPDVRSAFFGFYYGFSKMPEPMRPRLSDARVGYFSTTVSDFTEQSKREVKSRFINRWRLEKKDPSLAISEPKEPIVFWMDKNVPLEYRDTVKAGILEWNKAFEGAGYKDAIIVKQQADGDEFDTSATRYASIRWVTGRGISFGARGPSKVDPRTGEILDADIEMSDANFRFFQGRQVEDPPRPVGQTAHAAHAHFHANGELCTYAHGKANELAFALDLLAARGDFDQSSPEGKQLVLDAIKDTTIHEVGHTLGLRHNFVASMSITPEQLRDAKFGAENGIASSAMDYNGLNVALKDERQGQYSMITVGAYDKWAIEYGYKETTADTEKAELGKLLARATEPALAYATDEDAGFFPIVEGIDPAVNRLDLGNDPLAFYEKRFTLAKELWDRWQAKQLAPGSEYEVLRRNFQRGFAQYEVFGELAAKYVGGITVLRDTVGTGRQPLTPVDAALQRRALNLLTKNLFEVDSFKFKPEFLGKLSIDFDARWDDFDDDIGGGSIRGLDFSVAGRVLSIQRAVLSQLMRDTVAARVIGAPEKLVDPSKAFSVAELYSTLQKAVWSELSTGAAISPMRRNLQREHLRMIAQGVASPSPRTPADARSLQREFAVDLLAKMKAAVGRAGSIENRAHLNEGIALLDAALKAQITKALG
ncbi:MAG: DUF5117 domain-containing protein [Burkholderiales bacterium]|nr:MAG: DUF5117 domain-containing protein [Betaproteobacteria bacterium]TAG24839.1 MAG: DUF5117 domain-containing protein [Burkholderiales bacterium]